jgi:PAS domain S-box-containing protein
MVLKKEISHQIIDILKENPHGLSITDIVSEININRNTVGRYLENLLVSGQVEMRRFGMSKIYQLSHRVPLSAILSLSSEFVMQLDSSLRIVFANEPFLNLVGTDSKNLLGKNIEYTPVTLVYEESFPAFIENLRNGIAGKEWAGEIELTTKGIILFCRISPTVFEDGRKGVTVILEDITQRKQAEQKIKESELQFRLLAENTLDMICRIKPDLTLIYVSPVYKVTLGYLPEEVIGSSAEVFIHPEDAHILESLRNDLTPQNSSATIKFRLKHKDGHYIWTETTVRAIFDENTQELSEYYTVTRDITERKKAEEALRDSEKRHRTIFENTGTATVQIEENTIISLANAEFEHLSGFSRREIEGKKSWTEFVVKEDLELMLDQHQMRMEGQERPLKNYEFRFISKSGDLRNIFLTIDMITGTKKSVASLLDITERKIAETALRESEATARALINAPTDSVILADSKGVILALNETAASRFGKRSDELVGVLSDDLLPEDLARSRRSLISQVLTTKKMVRFEDERDGRWFDTVAYPVINETGEVTKVAIIARDITKQENTTKQLRESEQRFQRLLELSFDSLVIHKNNKVAFLNEKAAKILGAASPQDIIGRSILDFVHPDSRKVVEERVRMMSSGPDTPVPVIAEKFLRLDGTTVTVEVIAISYNDNGSPAVQVAFREIASQEGLYGVSNKKRGCSV